MTSLSLLSPCTKPRNRGFTLVETLVAISVLAIALVGPFVAVQNAVQGSYVARDQLIASQLAQEGVEYLRSIRDNNYHNGRTWLDGFDGAVRNGCYGEGPSGYCTVDPTQGDFHTVAAGMLEYEGTSTVPYLYVSGANLYNQQGSGSATKFKRLVQVHTISATEIRITVYVIWTTGTRSYTVTVTDNLHDWI
jgi:prepilin-type N-terminal cleavage/methylation domain-containing protein